MISFKTIKRKQYMGYDDRYSKDLDTVHEWLSDVIGDNGLFFSIRWHCGKTLSKTQLISRVHTIFNQVFHKLLGTHWIKLCNNHFSFILVEEYEKGKLHAHIALGLKTDKFTTDDVIKTLSKLQPRIKMEVYLKENDKDVRLTKKHYNNMVISPIYDSRGVAEYISKEFTICFNEHGHFVNVNHLILFDEVFPKKEKIILSPETKKSNAKIIRRVNARKKKQSPTPIAIRDEQ